MARPRSTTLLACCIFSALVAVTRTAPTLTIAFSSVEPGSSTNLNPVSFTLDSPLYPGTILQFELPAFQAPTGTLMVLSRSPSANLPSTGAL